MRKLQYILIMLVAIVMFSCTIETSDNGDLDGLWHLERVDTISTGGSTSLSDERVFWAVEHKLLRLNNDSNYYFMRFRQTSDSLIVNSPFRSNAGHGVDVKLDDPVELLPFGVEDLEVDFVKERLSGSRMVLRSRNLRLYFKKF